MRESPEVLFVTSTLQVGGSETKIVKIANALASAGYRVGIAWLNPPATLLDQVGPRVSTIHLERRGKFSLRSLRKLEDALRPAVRLVFSVNFYPLLYTVPAVRRLRGASGFPKAVCLVNTTDFGEGQRIWGRVYAPFLRRCDQLIYGCRQQQQLWTEKYRLPANRSRYIYNGVDCSRFSPAAEPTSRLAFRGELGIPEDAFVIGAVGRFAPEKSFELLIQTVGRLQADGRPAWLILAGEGTERDKLRAAAADAGLASQVAFPGVLRDVRPALAAMDVFVLPSRAVETFSNAALEAMSMARPVVLSDIGGAAEMIVPGESGYLFEAGRPDELLEALTRLHDSPSLRAAMGAAARSRVLERFGFETMMAEYEATIRSMLLERRLARA